MCLVEHFVESWNVFVGRDFKDPPVLPLAVGGDAFHWARLLQTLSSLLSLHPTGVWVPWLQHKHRACCVKWSPPCSASPSPFPNPSWLWQDALSPGLGRPGSDRALTFPQGRVSPAGLLSPSLPPGCAGEQGARCSRGPRFLRKPG